MCEHTWQAMSAESTARNRATLEEATNSAHFESTFFMSPLGGDGYGKTSRDIPSTVAPGKAAPALGAFEPASRQEQLMLLLCSHALVTLCAD
jgi:hypothetical protein